MTAKEQAQQAALELAITEGYGAAQYAEWETHSMADAASDVWEPLLRTVLEAYDWMVQEHTCCSPPNWAEIERIRGLL